MVTRVRRMQQQQQQEQQRRWDRADGQPTAGAARPSRAAASPSRWRPRPPAAGVSPRRSSRPAASQVARAIYDTLTIPDDDNNYVPFLAQSVTPNSKYTVWTITIRPGITFHDGTPLTAQVVKDNLDAYTGKTDSKNLLFKFEFDAEHWISDVKTTGPMTVEVDLKAPWVAFPSHLYSYGRLGIEAEAQLNGGLAVLQEHDRHRSVQVQGRLAGR